MDWYKQEVLMRQKIKGFYAEAKQDRLVDDAQNGDERPLRVPIWVNVVALLALIGRMFGNRLE